MKEINVKREPVPAPAVPARDGLSRFVLILIVASVFVIVPGGLFQHVLPKIAVLAMAVAFGLMAPSSVRLHPVIGWGAAAVFAVFSLSALGVDGIGPGFWGRWPRYEGVPTVAVYLLLLVTGARLLGPGTGPRRRLMWSRCLSWALVAMAAVAVIEGLGGRPLGENADFRPGSFLGNATDMGIVGVTGCAALLPQAVWKGSKREIAGACSGAVVAIASGSRAVMLVLLILTVTVLGHRAVIQWRTKRSLKPGIALSVALALAGVIAMAFPLVRDRILTSGTVTGRIELWTVSWALLQKHPLTGVGPGHFVDALPAFQSETFAALVGTDYPADSPHLILLQWWADGGIGLVLANMALCAAVISVGIINVRRCVNDNDRFFLMGCIGSVSAFAAVLMTHVPSPGTTAIAGLCAGALAGVPARLSETDMKARVPMIRRPVMIAGTAGCSAIGIASLFAASAELPLKYASNDVYAGKLSEASNAFEAAGTLRPWDADIAMLAGQSFAGRANAGDPEAGRLATEFAAKSLRINPGSVESLHSLGVGQLASGRIPEARHTFDTARQLAPVNSQIWLQSGLVEYAAGHTATAISMVEKAITLTPDAAVEREVLSALQNELVEQESKKTSVAPSTQDSGSVGANGR